MVDLADPKVRRLIERIFWARRASALEHMDMDPEDVLQDVYRSILVRNLGRNPFRPNKPDGTPGGEGGLSNYVWMVIRSVTVNQIDKEQRSRARNGILGPLEDAAVALDRASA